MFNEETKITTIRVNEKTLAKIHKKSNYSISTLSYNRKEHIDISNSNNPEIKKFFREQKNKHVIYFLYDELSYMYVGITGDPKERMLSDDHKEKPFSKILLFRRSDDDPFNTSILEYLEAIFIKLINESSLISVKKPQKVERQDAGNVEGTTAHEIIKEFIHEIKGTPIFAGIFKKRLNSEIYRETNKNKKYSKKFESLVKLDENRKRIILKGSKWNPIQEDKEYANVIKILISEGKAIEENGFIEITEDIDKNIGAFKFRENGSFISKIMKGCKGARCNHKSESGVFLRDIA
jgi:hypothetical protein